MKKKLLTILLATTLTIALTACGSKSNDTASNDSIQANSVENTEQGETTNTSNTEETTTEAEPEVKAPISATFSDEENANNLEIINNTQTQWTIHSLSESLQAIIDGLEDGDWVRIESTIILVEGDYIQFGTWNFGYFPGMSKEDLNKKVVAVGTFKNEGYQGCTSLENITLAFVE